MLRSLALASALLCAFTIAAEARQRHRVIYADPGCNMTGSNAMPCEGVTASPRGLMIERSMPFGVAQKIYKPRVGSERRAGIRQKQARVTRQRAVETASYGVPTPSVAYTVNKAVSQVIGGRPAGCPHAFCGCGASLHIFGRIIPSLNLAANWLRFPRAAPAPGMVAARPGHVFVLEQHIGGNVWLAHDSNSGRGLTRLHPRSIAGYSIVNPHGGSKYASAE